MQISVFYDHITQAGEQSGRSLSSLLNACREWGIDGLEINYTQLKEGGFWLQRALRKAGLKISCIYETYDFTHGEDLCRAKKHVDLAARVGAGKVLIVPGFLEEQEARELNACSQDPAAVAQFMENHASTCRVRDALRELAVYGRERNVRVTLEDFDFYTSPCAGRFALQWLMEQTPELGYTLDMGNFAYSDEDVTEAYELLKSHIVHVHCKDRGTEAQYQLTENAGETAGQAGEQMQKLQRRYCRGLACVPVGGGYLPIRELIGKLKDQGYDGYLAIEHFDAPDQLDYIQRSAAFLQERITAGINNTNG